MRLNIVDAARIKAFFSDRFLQLPVKLVLSVDRFNVKYSVTVLLDLLNDDVDVNVRRLFRRIFVKYENIAGRLMFP